MDLPRVELIPALIYDAFMTSSFSPSPFKSVSGLAMLASVGAHVVFFTGSALLSAPAPETPEKLRVVRLQRQAQNPGPQSPKNPDALLPPPPELPPKGQSSLAGLPSLKPNAQAFRQPSKVPPKVDLQALARKEQALRQELFLRQQQQQIREQQKILQDQQKAALGQQQQAAAKRKQALAEAEKERNQRALAANPINNDPQGGWSLGSGDVRIPPVAANQTPTSGPQQDGFDIPPPPGDPKQQGGTSGGNTSPPVNVADATASLSQTGQKAASTFNWLNKIARETNGPVPKSRVIEQQLAFPADAVQGKDEDNSVEVRAFITPEGEKRFPELIVKSEQVALNQAAIEAVKQYEPTESDLGKALVFQYTFQTGGLETPSSSDQPSTPPSEKEAKEQDAEPVESSDSKENKEKEKEKKEEEQKNKEEQDKTSAEKDEKPQEAEKTDESTSSQPEEAKNQDKKAVSPPAKPDSVGGAESQKQTESSTPTPDPQPSPTESSKPSPEPSKPEINSEEDKDKPSVPSSESQPSSEDENPLKPLNLDALKKK